jgi:cell wall-associated NlpC family hydrolase
VTRGHLVAVEAREWIGTPFVWGQSQKGAGCDCEGLIWGVAKALDYPEAASFYAQYATYRKFRPAPSAMLVEGMADLFDRVDEPEEGDILLLNVSGKPQHLAIYVGGGRVVHAHGEGEAKRVREISYRSLVELYPLHSIWRWRDGC